MTYSTLARQLGVPVDRIRRKPAPGAATERDLIRVNARKEWLCELVNGVLVDKALSFHGSYIATKLAGFLLTFVHSRRRGIVVGCAVAYRLRQGLVRLPAVSFVSWDQLPNYEIPDCEIADQHPDIAVELFNPGNRRREMSRKRHEYFRAGCRLVWIVFPKTNTIEVYTAPNDYRTLRVSDTLEGGDVLPGFKVRVATIFAPPPRPKKTSNRARQQVLTSRRAGLRKRPEDRISPRA